MIIPLEDADYIEAGRIFMSAFADAEYRKFQSAWINRTKPHSLGLWKGKILIGVAIVEGNRLHYIYIAGDHRSLGYGSKLLRAVLQQNPTIHLISVDNPLVHKWYVNHGFNLSQIDGSYRLYVHHSHNVRSRVPASTCLEDSPP